MPTETQQKRPTTLAELNMVMVEDTVCSRCLARNCHTTGTAISTSFHKGASWHIHIRVNRKACDDPCGSFVYFGDFRIDPTNEDPRNIEDREFKSELECVDFLLDNFSDIKCRN
jgi:hypothetical protein